MVRHSAHIFPIRYPQQRGDLLLPETGGLNSKIPIPGSVCGLRDTAAMTIQCWLLVVLPLLLAGAAMEVTLSPLITKFLLPPGG